MFEISLISKHQIVASVLPHKAKTLNDPYNPNVFKLRDFKSHRIEGK